MNKKLERLLKLRKRIIDNFYTKNWKEVWFFPSYKNVKGYEGTGKIMFVAENPSYGKTFPDKNLERFYSLLNKYKLENSHLTDLIKLRLSKEEVKNFLSNKKKMSEQINFLREEIKLLNCSKIKSQETGF